MNKRMLGQLVLVSVLLILMVNLMDIPHGGSGMPGGHARQSPYGANPYGMHGHGMRAQEGGGCYALHERMGLAVGVLVIGHLWLAQKPLSALCKRAWRKDTPAKVRRTALVDGLLILGFLAVLVSGIGCSVTILTDIAFPNVAFCAQFHQIMGYLMMALTLVHLWQHKGWVKGACRMVKRQISASR